YCRIKFCDISVEIKLFLQNSFHSIQNLFCSFFKNLTSCHLSSTLCKQKKNFPGIKIYDCLTGIKFTALFVIPFFQKDTKNSPKLCLFIWEYLQKYNDRPRNGIKCLVAQV